MSLKAFSAWLENRMAGRPPRLIVSLTAILRDDSGQDLIEYALVGALIALGTVASTRALATTIGAAFGRVGTSLSGAI